MQAARMMVRMMARGRLQEAFLAEARKGVSSERAGACWAVFKAVHISGTLLPLHLCPLSFRPPNLRSLPRCMDLRVANKRSYTFPKCPLPRVGEAATRSCAFSRGAPAWTFISVQFRMDLLLSNLAWT